ncbi:hypothetical protein ACIBCN_43900 [Nocardia sp. NPDC051052]|uniref:hypothetical protein n=1 Tax=Nocardia sp. NPDC051052 TaxID=3364322 RepID=UPI00379FEEBF
MAAIAVWAATRVTSIILLVVASFLLGSADVVIKNAAQSVLPQYVTPLLLPKANGNRQVVENLGESTLGPPLGSALFVVAAVLPFGLDAVSFAASAALLARLPRHKLEHTTRQSMGREIAACAGWVNTSCSDCWPSYWA